MQHPCGNGDPVGIECSDDDHNFEDPSTDLCAELDIQVGDACDVVDQTCVFKQAFTCISTGDEQGSSEEFLTCRDEAYEADLSLQCPESSRTVKRDIVYVDATEHRQLAKQVLDVKLARYNYIDPKKPGRKLGYILEDIPEASFSSGDYVDMYAYISAVVALTQQQQAEIERLKTEIETIKRDR
jgi:hypothetical protein